MLLDDVEEVVLIKLLDRAVDALGRLIDGHGADRHWNAPMIAVRTSSRLTPPVERSITVSARISLPASASSPPQQHQTHSGRPMLAFTLPPMPIAIGSRFVWLMLAGMIIRPRATSSITSDSGKFSVWPHGPFLITTLTGVVHLRDIGLICGTQPRKRA